VLCPLCGEVLAKYHFAYCENASIPSPSNWAERRALLHCKNSGGIFHHLVMEIFHHYMMATAATSLGDGKSHPNCYSVYILNSLCWSLSHYFFACFRPGNIFSQSLLFQHPRVFNQSQLLIKLQNYLFYLQ